MKNVFKFKTFRKNSIFLCCFLVVISLLDYFDKTIPSTIDEIITKDILLFILYFLLCFMIDVVKEKRNKKNKKSKE
ncbi:MULTISPECIES: hypothetical protein [Anaerostipes]|uniref:hypothetical protein n=1 Tax=Anaerostipes TaxID=207244 RepID=UPI0009528B6E|nr:MULTISPECIES: hypothetical protein [Anaerostipes]OLR58315.1 hypothetical protein BHF70_00960 [Anaerostipes sp. 494a]